MPSRVDQASRVSGPVAPIPLTVLTGFLGSGKTTLLNRLLRDPALADTAVLINEYGDVPIDHLLVEPVDGDIVMLPSGCLCCSLRGDLIDAFERLLRNLDNGRANFRRVIVETTGLADPAPVLHTVMAHPYLVMRYRLDGIVAVIDAVNGLATLDTHVESVKQAAMADRLVLTKTDLLDTPERRDDRDRLIARLHALNPAAPILDNIANEASPDRLLDCGLYDPRRKTADVRSWLAEQAYVDAPATTRSGHGDHAHHHHHEDHEQAPGGHGARIRSFVVATDAAIPVATFDMFLDLLRSLHGPKLLRLKGVVKIAETPDQPLVIHGVQHVLHPAASLPGWPDADRRTRMVFITYDLDPGAIRDLLNAFLDTPAPDRPDRAALRDNPLVPFGGVDR